MVHQKQLMRLSVQQFDLALIGGGLVGASFAHAIANSGLRVALIDKSPIQASYNPVLDNRGIAIGYTTRLILEELGIWEYLRPKANVIETVHVSEQNSFGFTKLTAKSCGLPALGYVISASDLGLALVHSVEILPNITVMRPAEISISNYNNLDSNWTLTVNNQDISAKLLIAADGANSAMRQKQNIPIYNKEYNQSAIITNIKIEAKDLTTAYERFCAEGILAFLPFGSCQVKFIWTVTNAKVNQLQGLSDAQFLAKLQSIIGFRLGKLISIDKRYVFAINHSYAEQLYGPGIVLLGNAANTLHPVAAQGFNLGIRDALTLAKVLKKALNTGENFGSPIVLHKYAAMRRLDHKRTRIFSNSLVDVFDNDRMLFKIMRRLGLLATQFIPYANRKIITQGLGPWI